MRQGVVRPETPRDRRQREGLEEDLRSHPQRGQRVPLRLRNFLPAADAYLAATRGPRPYMLRLREIESRIAWHEAELRDRWLALAEGCADTEEFAQRWRAMASTLAFDEVNDLIERHNRWYPIEANLAMDPRTGDYVLVRGRDYRLAPLDAGWALARFPPHLERARAAA